MKTNKKLMAIAPFILIGVAIYLSTQRNHTIMFWKQKSLIYSKVEDLK